ncbi:MAG: transcriptional repressor LexA [Christensenellaceae bacterium]|nr:transcriptional repressor LexA [Christensenellaceae bacterium]
MATRKEINAKLELIYDYIREAQSITGWIPSIRSICKALNFKSTASVFKYLRELESRGLVVLRSGLSRGIQLTNSGPSYESLLDIKQFATVTADKKKLWAGSNIINSYYMSKSLLSTENDTCILRVDGCRMGNVGMLSGVCFVVKMQDTAESGEIVAAMLDDDTVTIKRYIVGNSGSIRLHPENDDMPDIYAQSVKIIGVVIGLLRTEI